MKNIFKQLGVLDTPSKASDFKKAVLRLTFYYTVGVFCLLTIFSVLVYVLFSRGIGELRIETRESEQREEFKSEIQEHLLDILIISDAVLLVFSIFICYFLSKKTLQPLEDSYQKQKRFSADAAHELRTPLAVMKAGSEVLLRKDRENKEYQKFISESLKEVDRLILLSNDLLYLAQNKIAPNSFMKFSLSEICNKKIEQMTSYATLKNISLNTDIESNISMFGKPEDISRMILNLVKNAIDYNKIKGSVTLTLKKKQTKIYLTIKDTGIGIAQNDLPFIYERFYKADSSRVQTEHSGTGLGLAIVKEIVLEHKGELSVQSNLNQGTTFEIIF